MPSTPFLKRKGSVRTIVVAVLLVFVSSFIAVVPFGRTSVAKADTLLESSDNAQTSWYPNEPGLSPSAISSSDFGELFDTQFTGYGNIYAQPLVSQSVVLVATEHDTVYGVNAATGAVDWQTQFGTPVDSASQGACQFGSEMGITGTPVIDPSTDVAYFVTASGTGPGGNIQYFMNAVNVATGVAPVTWPVGGVLIQGHADDDAGTVFDGQSVLQRPGLVLVNGVVYASFGSQCDDPPWTGWLVGVSTSTASITSMWASETGIDLPDGGGGGAGIWMSGAAPVVDSQGNIYLATGNGNVPGPGSGLESPEPNNYGEAVVKLSTTGGQLKVVDWFIPSNAHYLNSVDGDLGSGGPVALPASMGTPEEPNVMVEIGKEGILYGLNMNSLGGFEHGPSESDAVPSESGTYGGVWSKPTVWPGDGGYIYFPTASAAPISRTGGSLVALQREVSASGAVYFQPVAATANSGDAYPFGSGKPIVTSNGTESGSAVLWIIKETGASSSLNAYNAIPQNPGPNGSLQRIWDAPIGTATTFSEPVADGGRIYVATANGTLLGFGLKPSSVPALSGNDVVFPSLPVSQSVTETATFTATEATTISSPPALVGSSFSLGSPTIPLPATLSQGQSISWPVTFTPDAEGDLSGTLTATDASGTISLNLDGDGLAATSLLDASPSEVDFGTQLIGGPVVSQPVTLTNVTGSAINITGFSNPVLPFTVTNPPADGVLDPGSSVTFTVSFEPPLSSGDFAHVFGDVVTVDTSVGPVGVPISGSANPPAQINITPTTLEFGNVAEGTATSLVFDVENQGSLPLTIIQSDPPSSNGFSATTSLPTSTVIGANATLFEQVQFAPSSLGTATSSWTVKGNDGSGPITITLTGTGTPPQNSGGGGGGGGGAAPPPPSEVPPPVSADVPASDFGTPSSVVTALNSSTASLSSNGISETLSIPAGALPSGTTVSLYPILDPTSLNSLVPTKQPCVVAFGVSWQAPDGTSPKSSSPITVTIEDPSIKTGDTIYEVTPSGLVAVGTASSDGSATVTFSSDPTFLISQIASLNQAPLLITSGPGQVGSSLKLTASGGSGTGAVSYTVTNGTATGCAVVGGALTAKTPGTCVVEATKAADANYAVKESSATSLEMVAKGEPAPVTIQFVAGRASLTPGGKETLNGLVKKLRKGGFIACLGYAVNNSALARKRASVVASYVSARVPVGFSIMGVTDGRDNWATVAVTR